MKDIAKKQTSTVTAVLKGVVCAFLITAVVFFVCAIIMTCSTNGIADKTLGLIIYITSAVSVMLGAMKTTSAITNGGLPKGLMVAVVYVAVIVLTGFFTNPEYSLGIKTLITLGACLAAGSLGGIIGINLKVK